MASRRVRIKGIANIPARKKTEEKIDTIVHNKEINETKPLVFESNSSKETENETNSTAEHITQTGSNNLIDDCNIETERHKNESAFIQKEEVENISKKETFRPMKRSIIKPLIKVDNLSRQKPHKTLDSCEELRKDKDELTQKELLNTNENSEVENMTTRPSPVSLVTNITNIINNMNDKDTAKNDSTVNFLKPAYDKNFISNKFKSYNSRKDESDSDIEMDSSGSKNIKFRNNEHLAESLIDNKGTRSGSDVEYPHPPVSPSKHLSRSRIKAIPCLTNRRISFSVYGSASESEDEGRKQFNRIRNDSVSSAISNFTENSSKFVRPPSSPTKTQEVNSEGRRKTRRIERSRKFAEARREFNMKFKKGIPDKQKLTMLDLIFYNPVTNPMSQNKKIKISDEEHCSNTKSDTENKTNTDNTKISTNNISENEEQSDDFEDKSDEEILAPQIKVGPNGEIIVDEKSLVIENKETKKNRENLQKSTLVDGDFETDFKGYQRTPRAHNWSKSETLRFYKALNSIGTDFSIMTEIFPNRTRKELKQKFNKEERYNQHLITKALTQPVEFDLTDLRIDLLQEEKEKEEKLKRESDALDAQKKVQKRLRKKRGSLLKSFDHNSPTKQKILKSSSKPKDPYSYVKKGIASVLGTDSEDEKNNGSDNNSETSRSDKSTSKDNRFEQILIPTRSGRIPKPTSRFSCEEVNEEPTIYKVPSNAPLEQGEIDINQLEVGSVLISTKESESGPSVRMFMMTEIGKNPVELSSEIVESLTKELAGSDNAPVREFLTNSNKVESERSVTLSAHIKELSEEVGVSLSCDDDEDENNLNAQVSQNFNKEHNYVLPVNISELHEFNLTIAHTEEIDMKQLKTGESTEDCKNVEMITESENSPQKTGKIVIKENILISSTFDEIHLQKS